MPLRQAQDERRGSFDPAVGRKVRGDRALVRQIGELAGGAGQMLVHSQKSWSSNTFAGTRHRMTWAFDGADAVAGGEALIDALPEHSFHITGQLVADAAVTSVSLQVEPPRLVAELELLLLEEA